MPQNMFGLKETPYIHIHTLILMIYHTQWKYVKISTAYNMYTSKQSGWERAKTRVRRLVYKNAKFKEELEELEILDKDQEAIDLVSMYK